MPAADCAVRVGARSRQSTARQTADDTALAPTPDTEEEQEEEEEATDDDSIARSPQKWLSPITERDPST